MNDRPDPVVRRATPDDADAFTEQRLALFREMLAPVSAAKERELARDCRAAFRAYVERETCLAWVACASDGRVIGSCAMFLAERLPSPTNPSALEGYVGHVYVSPDARRAGVGSSLVRAAMDEAEERGLGRIRLHATEPGRALYERLGFALRTNDMDWRCGART